jgi:hypothetical protein
MAPTLTHPTGTNSIPVSGLEISRGWLTAQVEGEIGRHAGYNTEERFVSFESLKALL